MKRFNYILVDSNFKPNNYTGFGFIKIPSLISRDITRILGEYSLPNLCTPTVNHLLHGLIKYYLDDSSEIEMKHSINFGEGNRIYRERKFNIQNTFLSLLPHKNKESLEKLIADLFYNALFLHEEGRLKKVFELV